VKAHEFRSILFALGIYSCCSLSIHADIRFVSPVGLGVAPYTTPYTASRTIQAAINVSSDGDAILVAPGVYQESIDFNGRNIMVLSLYAFCGDKAYLANTIIDGGGSNRVVAFHRHETKAAVLQGFTIRNGWCPPPPDPADKITSSGAGILCDQSSPTLRDLIVSDNVAGFQGGGIFCYQSAALVENVELIGNRANLGGGISATHGAPRFTNVKLLGNSAETKGGAIYLYYADAQLRNVLVAQNSAVLKGGGLFLHFSNPNMENMTVVDNTAPAGAGGGMNLSYVSLPTIKNSIFWGNSQEQIAFDDVEWHMSLSVSCSDVQGGSSGIVTNHRGAVIWGAENLELHPLFAAGEYLLTSNSPCIDRGWNEDWMAAAVDLAGNARIVNEIVDLGAYEYPETVINPSNVIVRAPLRPEGPTNGTAGVLLSYRVAGASSSDGSPVEYLVDWGDGATSGWSTSTNYSHAWSGAGNYGVRARARATSDPNVISSWSPLLSVSILPIPHSPTTLYVSPDGLAKDGYTNWAIAARSIQAAINASINGDEILVAPGKYQEPINFLGKAITVQSLYSISNDRTCIANTLIDGGRTSRVVVFNHHETGASMLRGFTITNGWCPTGVSYLVRSGGGIFCDESSPALKDLIVSGNVVGDGSEGEGGGIFLYISTSRVENVELIGNRAFRGGGIRTTLGGPSFENMKFEKNYASYDGGALFLYHSVGVQMRNILMAQNQAALGGGGICLDDSDPIMENLTVVNNTASAGRGGGLSVSYSSHPIVKNCIFWGNSQEQIAFDPAWMGMALTVSYSDIESGQAGIATHGLGPVNWGTGNLNLNPLFMTGTYTLASNSPCVNSGLNAAWMATATDLAGTDRIVGGIVDMGAYECPVPAINPPPGSMTLYVSPDGLAKDGYTNWTIAANSIQAAIDISSNGYQILVAPGVYREPISFLGKAITVQSLYSLSNDSAYIANTIIDGGGTSRVVTFNQGESAAALLSGFTITNGWCEGLGGIHSDGGAGVLCEMSSPTLKNLIVSGNEPFDCSGGGMAFVGSTSWVENVHLIGNRANSGGAMSVHGAAPSFFNVIVRENSGGRSAIDMWNGDGRFRNVLVVTNDGAGFFLHESSPILENVTVVDNAGLAINLSIISRPVIKNSLFWGNAGSFGGWTLGVFVTVIYSDIQGGKPIEDPEGQRLDWGPGNLDMDPLFEGPGYALTSLSPCIGVGTNEDWMTTATDLAGNDRIINGTVDMGAYECAAQTLAEGYDMVPPSILSLLPPDGYVSASNWVQMQMVVTDNVEVAGVTVNGASVSTSDHIQFNYTASGIWGLFNNLEVVAQDTSGNCATRVVNYAQCTNITLYALWEDYWMVLNPFTNAVAYQWNCAGATNVSFGMVEAHSSSSFTTTGNCASIEFQCPGYLVATRSRSSLRGPPTFNAAQLDSDGDGISNWSEDMAGTDLNDISSFFGMGSASLQGGDPNQGLIQRMLGSSDPQNLLTFSWQSAIGRLYTIERSADLLDWATAPDGENMPGTGGLMIYTNSSTDGNVFIRVKAQKAR
jgi:hypothetical protein